MYNEVLDILLLLEDIKQLPLIQSYGFKWAWAYPITHWVELESIVALNPSSVLIGGDLFFDLPKVSKFDIPIRIIVNQAYDNYIAKENGINGTYMRPEDAVTYEKYVDIAQFSTQNPKQERALFDIYTSKKWEGNLNLIINNLNYNIDNRGIPTPEFAERRINCRHICSSRGCRYCFNEFMFITLIDKKDVLN